MATIKKDDIKKILNSDDQAAQYFLEDYNAISKQEKALIQVYDTFSTNIQNKVVPNESLQALKNIFMEYGETQKKIQTDHKTYVDIYESKVIPVIKKYNNDMRNIKSILDDYEKKSLNEEVKFNEFLNATKKKDQLQNDYNKLKEKTAKLGSDLSNKLKPYIINKSQEFKHTFMLIINKQMTYHAQSIEKLSELSQLMNKQNEMEDAQGLIETLTGNR